MAVSYMDFTSPNVQFTYDLKNNNFFTKDSRNLINALSISQLNTLGNVSLLDIYLSTGNVVEPHIHQNATELVYCISGAALVSLINPFTKTLINIPIVPGQVANIPQGWWHYEMATVDNTHLLAIFDQPVPEFIPGSDLFRLTPASVLAHTYCLDEAMVKETFAPITQTVVIGPPADCNAPKVAGMSASPYTSQPQGGYYQQQPNGQRQMPFFGYPQYQQYEQVQHYPQYPSNVIGNGWEYGYSNFNG